MFKLLIILFLLFLPTIALAYIGPGAGISVLGSLLGILGTIVVAIGAILFWPVRKFLKRKKQRANSEESTSVSDTTDPGA